MELHKDLIAKTYILNSSSSKELAPSVVKVEKTESKILQTHITEEAIDIGDFEFNGKNELLCLEDKEFVKDSVLHSTSCYYCDDHKLTTDINKFKHEKEAHYFIAETRLRSELEESMKINKVLKFENFKDAKKSYISSREDDSGENCFEYVTENDSNSEFAEAVELKNFDHLEHPIEQNRNLILKDNRKSEVHYQSMDHEIVSKKVLNKTKK